LQQMEQRLQQGDLSSEKSIRAVKNLLTQIDLLNDIATSFSAFARMPSPVDEKVDLIALLRRVTELYAGHNAGTVLFENKDRFLEIQADPQLLSRVFSNIVLNALQSGADGKPVSVVLLLERNDQDVLISITDNGKGIDEAVREKLFTPYFSTKKSGSGLGLAIAKEGITQSGGTIWFETLAGKGSVFFIRLPIKTN